MSPLHHPSVQAELQARERALAESETRYRLAFDASLDAINIIRLSDGLYLDVNHGFEAVTGWSRADVVGRSSLEVGIWHDPLNRERLIETLRRDGQCVNLEAAFVMRNGQLRWGLMSARLLQLNGEACILSVTRDITERREAQQRIEHMQHYDALTGLPNRAELAQRFTFVQQQAQRKAEPLAVLFIDVDHFKAVNDTLGHSVGDQVLVELAQRMQSRLRGSDSLGRLSGDAYIALLPGADADRAAKVATKMLEIVAQPCTVQGQAIGTSVSVGVAVFPEDGQDFETLARHADNALHRAKNAGRNGLCFYAPEMQRETARRLALSAALRFAAARGELSLCYQPQVQLPGGRVLGVEALLRWTHPTLGVVGPAEFIPVAESSGLMPELGAWVLRTALAQARAWRDKGLPHMVMAVNLSATQFGQVNLVEQVATALHEQGLPPDALELELTEATAMHDPAAAIAMLASLHGLGVRLAIDDFGTGYSSLSYLKKFRVARLKIDQSFVRDIVVDPEDRAIVDAVVRLAGGLGVETLAEGVEHPDQLADLMQQGCQAVQGFLFSPALSAAQLHHWLVANGGVVSVSTLAV